MAANVRKVSETSSVITITWDCPTWQEGYVPTIDGSEILTDGKRHAGTSKTINKVTIRKPLDVKSHQYGVNILGTKDSGYVTSPPGTTIISKQGKVVMSPTTTAVVKLPSVYVPPPSYLLPHAGISPGSEGMFTRTAAARRAELDQIQAVGCKLVRIDCTPGGQTQADAYVADCEARNLKLLLTLWGTTGPTTVGTFGTTQANKWASHPLVVGFEIANEPDLNGWTPSGYAAFAKTAVDQIAAAQPGRFEIVPGALWKGTAGDAIFTFTDAMIAAGVFTNAGTASFHGYDIPNVSPIATWNVWSMVFPITGGSYNGQTMREKLNASGHSAVKIICTEAGSGQTNQATQAAETHTLMTEPRVPVMCYYRMTRDGAFPEDALLNTDGTRRQAWNQYLADSA